MIPLYIVFSEVNSLIVCRAFVLDYPVHIFQVLYNIRNTIVVFFNQQVDLSSSDVVKRWLGIWVADSAIYVGRK